MLDSPPMSDRIFIEALEIPCIIGIFDWERKQKQTVMIDLEFPANVRKAAKQDRIKDAVDYKKISKFVIQTVSESRFQLIETLAETLAGKLLKKFRLKSIRLRVSKPGALRGAKNVGIEIKRRLK